MLARKVLAPNNSHLSLAQLFDIEAQEFSDVKSIEPQSAVTYAQPGRQEDEGFGGGNRISRGVR
jgi:hypothetical protein